MNVSQLRRALGMHPAMMEVKVVVFLHDFPPDRVFQVMPVTAVQELMVIKKDTPYVGIRTGAVE